MNKLILASSSPRRSELLRQVGIEFQIMVRNTDENIGIESPEKLVLELSRRKAMAVAESLTKEYIRENRQLYVIGADTVVALGKDVMGKPKTEDEAQKMLQTLQGEIHQVFTGVAILCITEKNGIVCASNFAERTDVELFPMTDQEIESYVKTGDPMDKAGAYGIQGLFGKFVRSIKGEYNNVVGLPVARVYHELLQAGWNI